VYVCVCSELQGAIPVFPFQFEIGKHLTLGMFFAAFLQLSDSALSESALAAIRPGGRTTYVRVRSTYMHCVMCAGGTISLGSDSRLTTYFPLLFTIGVVMIEFLLVVLGCFCLVLGVAGVVWAYHMIVMNHDRIDEINTNYVRIRQLERDADHQGRIILELLERVEALAQASDLWGDSVEQTLANMQLRYEELYRVNSGADDDTNVAQALLRCAGWVLDPDQTINLVGFGRDNEALGWTEVVGWVYMNSENPLFERHLNSTISRYKQLTDLEEILHSAPHLLMHKPQ